MLHSSAQFRACRIFVILSACAFLLMSQNPNLFSQVFKAGLFAACICFPSDGQAGFLWTPAMEKEVPIAPAPNAAPSTTIQAPVQAVEAMPLVRNAPVSAPMALELAPVTIETSPMEGKPSARDLIETTRRSVRAKTRMEESKTVLFDPSKHKDLTPAPHIDLFPLEREKPVSLPHAQVRQPVRSKQSNQHVSRRVDLRAYQPGMEVARSYVPEPARRESVDMGSPKYDIADGFGKDIPLEMAVQQIIPTGYTHRFGKDADAASLVSWQGGRAWDNVLMSAVAPLGLNVFISDNDVEIATAPASSMPSSPPRQAMVMTSGVKVKEAPRPASLVEPPVENWVPPVSGKQARNAMPTLLPAADNMDTMAIVPVVSDLRRGGLTGGQKVWEAARGATLRDALAEWSKAAGVELHWSSGYDYPLQAKVRLNGTYKQAVEALLAGLKDAQPRPIGRLHPNLPDGPAVLVIKTRHVMD